MIDSKPATAIVEQAVESERQLIERAISSLSRSNWEIGECAYKWHRDYAGNRTDEQFGHMIGLSRSMVQRCRSVWETFGDVYQEYPNLRFDHFYVAKGWDESAECLSWADENRAPVNAMVTWRRTTFDVADDEPNDHFEDEGSCHNVADDNDQSAECAESTDINSAHSGDEQHAADADPYQKPPSTVVNTPRDFKDEPEKPARPVARHVNADDVMSVLNKAVDAWSAVGQDSSDRRALAASLRQLADEIEGAA